MTIEQQLKTLKNARVMNPEAAAGTRRLLTQRAHYLSSIQARSSVYRNMQIGMWQTWHFSFAHVRQVAAVLIITVISGTGTMVARASMAAVSGDTLYPIKRNLIEKVELVLAPTAQDEASVYLRHVATRLDEIRVLNDRDIPEQEKADRISHTVLALNRDLTAARQSLRMAAKDTKATAVVAVAKGLTKATSDVKAALTSSGSGSTSTEAVAEAITSADLATADSLEILLDNVAGGDVSNDELSKLVGEAITATEQRLKVTEKAVLLSGGLDVRTKVRQSLYSAASDRTPTPFDMPTFDGLRTDLGKVSKQLDEAKQALQFGNFKLAVQWNTAAGESLDTIEDVLNQASQLVNQALLPTWQPAATSTPTSTSPVATTTAAVTVIEDPVGQLEVVESKPVVAPAKK